ncbi:helix-turn-helix domain-containing protein [Brucellaceae bacterium D45D]
MKSYVSLSTDMVDPKNRTDFWRSLSETIYDDVVTVNPEQEPDLRGSVQTCATGRMIIANTSFNAQHCKRTARAIAKNGADFVAFQTILTGTSEGSYNGKVSRTAPGDIFMLDLSQVMESKKQPGSRMSIIVPRAIVGELLSRYNFHGLVLPQHTAATKLLFQYMIGINKVAAELDEQDTQAVQDALFTLLGSAIGNSDDNYIFSRPIDTPMRQRIVDYIDANLTNPYLDVDAILEFFRVSRTHLYRAFKQEGGVAHAIRDRRLNLAFRLLIDQRENPRSVDEIKSLCGFAQRTQFIKFFQQKFGFSPRDLHVIATEAASLFEGPLSLHNHILSYADAVPYRTTSPTTEIRTLHT